MRPGKRLVHRRAWRALPIVVAALALPGSALAADTANSFLDEAPISAGGSHTCGIEANGELACWGDDSSGQTDAPGGVFLAVAAGGEHSCGIRASGLLSCWGDDSVGQRDGVPAGTFIAVSAGDGHTCAIRTDGTLACWGDDSSGQLDGIPSGEFHAVSAGGRHTCAIDGGGTLACWGDDSAGQLDGIPSGRFRSVSAGGRHTCAIRADGALACWGDDSAGQLDGVPSGEFRAVSAGGRHTCAIDGGGTLACWGDDSAGQLDGIPSGRFRSVSAGAGHTCAIRTDGATVCWGTDLAGEPAATPPAAALGHTPLAAGNDSNYNCTIEASGQPTCWGADAVGEPIQDAPEADALAVSGEGQRACMLTAAGEPRCWGSELQGPEPPPVGEFQGLTSTANDSCAIRLDGSLSCWGEPEPVLDPPMGAFEAVSGGGTYACAIRMDGTLTCWGGADQPTLRDVPTGEFRALTTGEDRACALRTDGTLACWGSNGLGYVDPVPAGEVRAVVSGAFHMCAVLAGGELTCWENGQTTDAAPGTFYSLAAGVNHTCGVRTDGAVICRGHDEYGQSGTRLDELKLPRAVIGTAYSHRLTTIPAEPAPELSVGGGSLPAGLSLDREGLLSGTATTAGSYTFTVEIGNGVAEESEEGVTMEVVGAPAPAANPAQGVGSEAATLSGTVDPRNLPAEAWFEYWPVGGSSQSAVRTPAQPVAKGLAPVALSAAIAGLTPQTEYLFRLSAGNELGGEPAHSETLSLTSALPPPTDGQTFDVETVEGTVTTRCPADTSFTGLVRAELVPVGCLIDTTRGTVRLTASKGQGETQSAYFWGGVFRVTQDAGQNQTAVLKLVGQLRCERRSSRGRRVNRRGGGGGRKLWGSGKGNYKTVGSHGAATVRGTIWLVQDRCDGSTLVKVKHGTVWVRDFVKGIKVVLQEGEQYLIEPPTDRLGK